MLTNPFYTPGAGLAGGTVTGYNHQAGWGPIPDDVRPTACWMEAPVTYNVCDCDLCSQSGSDHAE
jgi:hypothetical protein